MAVLQAGQVAEAIQADNLQLTAEVTQRYALHLHRQTVEVMLQTVENTAVRNHQIPVLQEAADTARHRSNVNLRLSATILLHNSVVSLRTNVASHHISVQHHPEVTHHPVPLQVVEEEALVAVVAAVVGAVAEEAEADKI